VGTNRISYGSGGMEGVQVRDDIAFGKVKVPNVGFLVATDVGGWTFEDVPFDGIMGMSRHNKQVDLHWAAINASVAALKKKEMPDIKKYETRQQRMTEQFEHLEESHGSTKHLQGPTETVNFNFLLQAKKQGALRRAMISFFLGQNGGAVVLGGVDRRYHTEEIHYHPAVRHVTGAWVLEVQSLRAAGHEVCPQGCLALVDSGTTQIVVPTASAWAIKITAGQDCAGNAEFQIGKKVHHLDSTQWCGRMLPLDERVGKQLKTLTTDPAYAHHTWIVLGEAFLQGFYTVFDNTNTKAPQIGLAPLCKESQAMCKGKASMCGVDDLIRTRCPITCEACGTDKRQMLDTIQFEP